MSSALSPLHHVISMISAAAKEPVKNNSKRCIERRSWFFECIALEFTRGRLPGSSSPLLNAPFLPSLSSLSLFSFSAFVWSIFPIIVLYFLDINVDLLIRFSPPTLAFSCITTSPASSLHHSVESRIYCLFSHSDYYV